MAKRAHLELGFGMWAFIVASAGGALVTACSLGGETIVNETQAAETADGGGATTSNTTGAAVGGGSAACAGGKLAKADLGKLKACQPGGHCFDKAKTPGALAALLVPCDDATQLCVPDEVLAAGGDKLQSCTQPDSVASVAGPGGGCVNLGLMPDVQKQAGQFLQQRECPSGLTCLPCKNPQDNSDSPFCQAIGVYDDASCAAPAAAGGGVTGDGGAAPGTGAGQACCTENGKSNGVCMSATILPADQQGAMPQDTCATTDICMPAAMVQGKATSCDAGLLFGKGICLDQCFNSMLEVGGFLGVLSSDGCGDTEVCTPCDFLQSQMPAGLSIPGCE